MQLLSGTQAQESCEGAEVCLEIGNRYAVRVLVVDAETSADVDVLHMDVLFLQPILDVIDTVAESGEVVHVENLAADMEVQTDEPYVLHVGGRRDGGLHILHGYAKLVLCQSGRDFCMCMRTYVWIDAETDVGHFAAGAGQFIDDLQFGDTLNIETENLLVESEIDLQDALADACIDNLRCREAGVDGGLNLSAADAIDTQS